MPVQLPPQMAEEELLKNSVMRAERNPFQQLSDLIFGRTLGEQATNAFTNVQPLSMLGKEQIGKVYHGTKRMVQLDPQITGTATGNPASILGTFFTPRLDEAQRYVKDFHGGKGVVLSADVNLSNPYRMSFGEYENLLRYDLGKGLDYPTWRSTLQKRAIDFKNKLIREGHDGIVIGDSGKWRPQEIVAFDKPQIQNLEQMLPTGAVD